MDNTAFLVVGPKRLLASKRISYENIPSNLRTPSMSHTATLHERIYIQAAGFTDYRFHVQYFDTDDLEAVAEVTSVTDEATVARLFDLTTIPIQFRDLQRRLKGATYADFSASRPANIDHRQLISCDDGVACEQMTKYRDGLIFLRRKVDMPGVYTCRPFYMYLDTQNENLDSERARLMALPLFKVFDSKREKMKVEAQENKTERRDWDIILALLCVIWLGKPYWISVVTAIGGNLSCITYYNPYKVDCGVEFQNHIDELWRACLMTSSLAFQVSPGQVPTVWVNRKMSDQVAEADKDAVYAGYGLRIWTSVAFRYDPELANANQSQKISAPVAGVHGSNAQWGYQSELDAPPNTSDLILLDVLAKADATSNQDQV